MNSQQQYHHHRYCRSPRDHDEKKQQHKQEHQQRRRQQHQCANHISPPPPPPPSERPLEKKRPKIVELSDEDLSLVLTADGYQLGSTIGHGSYSKVRMAMKSMSDNTVARRACKVIDKRRESGGSYVRKFLPRELEVLSTVRHPNIVRTHRIYVTPSTVHVFMDYCEIGDLLSHLQNTKSIPNWQSHLFFKQMCEAVSYLHQNDISHRDIKCENVLLESTHHVKLTDFGFARVCVDDRGRRLMSQTFCGSSAYAAPEVLQGIPYDPKAYDVWALGVVLFMMLTDTMPYPQINRQKIVSHQMAKKFVKPKRPVTQTAMKLISFEDEFKWANGRTILEPDVTKRPDMNQIKNHAWVKQQNPYNFTH